MRLSISLQTIEHLFPFSLVVSDEGLIAFVGRSLKKMAPHLLQGQPFSDFFTIIKPQVLHGNPDWATALGKMTVIQERQTKAKLMGQWVRPGRKPIYAFVGSLSVTDPSELRDLGLDFSDFPIQDQIFDFLMLSQTQKRTISEAALANRKLAEAHQIAIQASEMKSQFLANMSHELRTPMNGVLGMASVLKEATELSEEQKEYVDNIIQSGETMLALINDILDLTKVESGFIQLDFEMISIFELLEDVRSVIEVSARKKGNVIGFSVADNVPRTLETDHLRLRQILVNLVGNANKFTEDGEISIRVECVSSHQERVLFSVRDNGIGMSSETQSRIFQPFIQGDSSMTKKFGGTGLGLSISKKLVEALGGRISCESKEGQGSTFQFEIALNPREPDKRKSI